MENGFVKLSRSFFSTKKWQAARTFSDCEAWLDLIQSARFERSRIISCIGESKTEVEYGRGQYPASIRFLARRWGRSERSVRSFLAYLRREGMITTSNLQGITLITLVNYEKYNSSPEKEEEKISVSSRSDTASDTPNSQIILELQRQVTQLVTQVSELARIVSENNAEKRHTPDTKNKNIYNNILKENNKENSPKGESKKEEKNLSAAACAATLPDRRKAFYDSLVPYVGQYGKETVREFFDYWTETNENGRKMRFEKEKTFGLGRRLATWKKREEAYGTKNRRIDNLSDSKRREEETDRKIVAYAARAFGLKEGSDPPG